MSRVNACWMVSRLGAGFIVCLSQGFSWFIPPRQAGFPVKRVVWEMDLLSLTCVVRHWGGIGPWTLNHGKVKSLSK